MFLSIKTGRQTVLQYTLHAFTTPRGTFTLVGAGEHTDTFKNLTTGEYHDWERSKVMEWVAGGKVTVQEGSERLDWYRRKENKSEGSQAIKTRRK